jgi:hypothetical protein
MSFRNRLAALLRRPPVPLAVAAVFFAQIYWFQWHPGYPNPNEVIRIYLTRAIVEEGTFEVDGLIRRFGNVEDRSVFRGRTYSDKAPGVSFLGIVPFAVVRAFGDVDMKTARHAIWLGVVALPSLLFLLALWRFFERFGLTEGERALLTVAFGMGSLHYTFSTLLFSHALAGVLAMSAFLAARAARRGEAGPLRLAAGGLAAGLALITEYPTVIPLFFVFLYLCLGPTWKRAWIFALGALPPIAAGLLYHNACFGSPLATGYSHLAQAFFARVHETGLLGVSTPKWAAFSGSFFGPSRGLFWFAPWLLFALPGIYLLLRRREWRAEGLVVLGTLVGYGYFISSFGYWQGGGTVGQRHLTPLVPFLLLPVAEILRRLREGRRAALQVPLRASIAVGIVLTVGCTVPWPYVSSAYANPWSEISLPMWREAIVPPALLEAVGFSLPAAILVFFLAVGATLWTVAAGPPAWPWRTRLLHGSAVVTVAALALLGALHHSYRPEAQGRYVRDRQGIARLVDFTDRRPAAREKTFLRAEAARRALTPTEMRRLGYLLAREGETAGALHWYRRAVGPAQ